MAPKESLASPGRSEPGQRKIGGDLQGEPIFRLRGPAAALGMPIRKAAVVAETGGGKDDQGRNPLQQKASSPRGQDGLVIRLCLTIGASLQTVSGSDSVWFWLDRKSIFTPVQ